MVTEFGEQRAPCVEVRGVRDSDGERGRDRDGAGDGVRGGPFAYGEAQRRLDRGERRPQVLGGECRVQFQLGQDVVEVRDRNGAVDNEQTLLGDGQRHGDELRRDGHRRLSMGRADRAATAADPRRYGPWRGPPDRFSGPGWISDHWRSARRNRESNPTSASRQCSWKGTYVPPDPESMAPPVMSSVRFILQTPRAAVPFPGTPQMIQECANRGQGWPEEVIRRLDDR